MQDKNEVHVFWRNIVYPLTRIDPGDTESLMPVLEEFVWDVGVFETDEDPMWVFVNGELVMCWRLAHTFRGYAPSAQGNGKDVLEFRVVNMFTEQGVLIDALTMERRYPENET